MMRSKNLVSIALAGLMVFTSSVCACADTMADTSDSAPHAHHQMQDSQEAPENALCPHEDCEDCDTLVFGAKPDRDAKTNSFSKFNPDDDIVWLELAASNHPLDDFSLARAGPVGHSPPRLAETPVSRADILLQ